MKIAIISDLHLGFRQYGSIEREKDFYNQLYKVCNEINKQNPDIVIIAGDLFNNPNPSPAAINAYRKGIGILNANIICSIKGNHTMLLRDDHYSIDEYFSKDEFEGYYYLDDSSFSNENIQIDGITYRSNSSIDEFLEVQKDIASKEIDEEKYRILVVHQSFKEFCGFIGEELSIEDIDISSYNAVICGHIHSRFDIVLSDGVKFIQPGSIERMNTTEALDEQKNGKGFYLLDTEDNSVKFYPVKCNRAFFLGEKSFSTEEDLENHFKDLSNAISKLDTPPIISYKYKNYGVNIEDIRDEIKLLHKNVLLDKSNIDDLTQEDISIEIEDNEMPTVFEAIKIFGEKSGLNEDEYNLARDLHKELNNNLDNVSSLLDNYFEKHKKKYDEYDFYDEKELKEIIDYFGE